jgi:tetratricopeptide (TPR) repeat protein
MPWQQAAEALKELPQGALLGALAGLEPETIQSLQRGEIAPDPAALLARPAPAPPPAPSGLLPWPRKTASEEDWQAFEMALLQCSIKPWPEENGAPDDVSLTAALRWPKAPLEEELLRIHKVWMEQGEFDAVGRLWERVQPEGAEGLECWGIALFHQGWYEYSRMILERAVERSTGLLGPEHPNTLRMRGNLANTLQAWGDLAGARSLFEQVVEAQRRRLGAEHHDTLVTLKNLDATLSRLDDLSAARSRDEETLAVLTPFQGVEHPGTLRTLGNLGVTRVLQGDLSAARAHLQEALEAQTRLLGAEHPDTLRTLHNLAHARKAQGDLAGARSDYERALAARSRVLGPEHPDTQITRYGLVHLLLETDPPAAQPQLALLLRLQQRPSEQLRASEHDIVKILADLLRRHSIH